MDRMDQAVQQILLMFQGSDLDAGIVKQYLESNDGDIDKTLDELLNLTSDEAFRSVVQSKIISAGYSISQNPYAASSNEPSSDVQAQKNAELLYRQQKEQEEEDKAVAFRLMQERQAQEALEKQRKEQLLLFQEAQRKAEEEAAAAQEELRALDVVKLDKDMDPADFLEGFLKSAGIEGDQEAVAEHRRALEARQRERERNLQEERQKIEQHELEAREQLEIERQLAIAASQPAPTALEDNSHHNHDNDNSKTGHKKPPAKLTDPNASDGGRSLTASEIAAATARATTSSPQEAGPSSSASPSTADAAARPKVPIVAMYYRAGATAADLEEMVKIKEFFEGLSVAPSDIRMVDVTNDPELQAWLKESCGDEETNFPIVTVHDQVIGDLAKVVQSDQDGQLKALLEAGPAKASEGSDPSQPELNIGVLGGVLNVGEYVMSGVGSLLALPWTIVSYPFRSDQPELPAGQDFLVVHQNWYWRNLHRIFRLTDSQIMRIHPKHMDIRASHPYDAVSKVIVSDESNIIIMYFDGSSPDYIRAPPDTIERMINIMRENSGGKINFIRAPPPSTL